MLKRERWDFFFTFSYKTVPHITLKSIANNEPPEPETLYDQPLADNSKARVTGPFTVEAVPAPMVKSLAEISGEEAERTSFEIPTVSLHVHERIDPRSIIEAVRKKNGSDYEQMSLFNSKKENPPLREAIEFYQHAHNWSNRLIAGDSLLVMNSLLEKEGMAGQLQMLYFDPPYGIKYGSNFQPFVNKRDVKDGKDDDLTAEPETIKAFRDTWELGLHSYLSYLRDRLLVARELLHESGSVFVQIGDQNVHLVRAILDEVFGPNNFISQITFRKTGAFETTTLGNTSDFLLWYAKDLARVKCRKLFQPKPAEEGTGAYYRWIELPSGERRSMTSEERENRELLPKGSRYFLMSPLSSAGPSSTNFVFEFEGKDYSCDTGSHWKTTKSGLEKLAKANRLVSSGQRLYYVRYLEDFPVSPFDNMWVDTVAGGYSGASVYVVRPHRRRLAMPEIVRRRSHCPRRYVRRADKCCPSSERIRPRLKRSRSAE